MRWLIPLLAALVACVKPLPPTMSPDGRLTYATEDGWANELRHYAGSGDPVVLLHGMAANHYNFDYRPEVSLAAHLQDRGFDVWIPELRGDPGATPPPVERHGASTSTTSPGSTFPQPSRRFAAPQELARSTWSATPWAECSSTLP